MVESLPSNGPSEKRACFRYEIGKRRDLFKSRYTLLKGAERLVDWEKARLNELFYRYPELGRAWVLKESFRDWHRGTDGSRAKERLRILVTNSKGAGS